MNPVWKEIVRRIEAAVRSMPPGDYPALQELLESVKRAKDMTTTTVLHTTVAREISRIREYLGHTPDFHERHLEAHELAAALRAAVDELMKRLYYVPLPRRRR